MDTVQILVQGGAVGISLVCLYIIYYFSKTTAENNRLLTETLQKIADDHRQTIERNTNAWNQNTRLLARLSEKIENDTTERQESNGRPTN